MRKIAIFLFMISSLYSEMPPQWVFGINEDENYIYGIGSAPKQNSFSRQLRVAKMLARASLSENIKVQIESKFEKNSGSKMEKDISYEVIQTSKNVLKYLFVKEYWISGYGEIFILMAIRKEDVL
jgi:hypothetical protein